MKIKQLLLGACCTVAGLLAITDTVQAQCISSFTWTQDTANVISFTNTSNVFNPNTTNYVWDFGDNTNDFSVNPSHIYNTPGNYVVSLSIYDSTNTSCNGTYNATINVTGDTLGGGTSGCNLTYSIIPTAATCPTCADGSVVLYSNATSYYWSNGATTSSIYNLLPGAYSVILTDGSSCVDTAYTYVNADSIPNGGGCNLTFSVMPTAASCATCADGSISAYVFGGSGSYTYSWSNGATTASISGLTYGGYTLSVTDTDSASCSSSTIVYVDSLSSGGGTGGCNLNPMTWATNATCPNCADGSAMVIANGNAVSYAWSNGATTNTIANLLPGNYSVIVSDSTGCIDTAYVYVGIDSTYTGGNCSNFYVNVSSTDATCPSCIDGSATATPIGGTAPYTYMWFDNDSTNTATANNLAAGYYGVYVTDANGCSFYNAANVGPVNTASCSAYFYAYADSLNPTNLILVNMASGNGSLTYSWNWNDGSPLDNAPYPTHTYSVAGTYSVCLTITDGTNCTSTYCFGLSVFKTATGFSKTIGVVAPAVVTKLEEQSAINEWLVFPNPAVNQASVSYSLNKASNVSIELYDVVGKQVSVVEKSTAKAAGKYTTTLNTSNLSEGMYLVKIISDNQVHTKRLTVTK